MKLTTIITAMLLLLSITCYAQQKTTFNETITWTTEEQDGKIGLGYTEDGKWVWAIKPMFDKVAKGAQFISIQ